MAVASRGIQQYAMPTTKFSTPEKYEYRNGFGSLHESEAVKDALPVGANSPQQAPHGLYAEKLSGTAFTAPRHENLQTWAYRILPSASHLNFEPLGKPFSSQPKESLTYVPNQLRWDPFDIDKGVDWVRGLRLVAGAGDPTMKSGLGIYVYTAGKDMAPKTAMYSSDGEMLIVTQTGVLDIQTELGNLLVRPNEIAVIPRGMKYRVTLPEGPVRGYILELYRGQFTLPELGPIGSNCLANARDFQVPVASFDEDTGTEWSIINKFNGQLFVAKQSHTPFDVVAWHGSDIWHKEIPFHLSEDTFRPPWYHRNTMSEFMGLIQGDYDAKAGGGFRAGGASLHNVMSAHGPDATTFDQASNAELKPQKVGEGSMAFMFESSLMLGLTEWGLETCNKVQPEYNRESCPYQLWIVEMDVPGFALITGAASGLGNACAKAFAREGSAGIALLDINEEGLMKARDEIEGTTRERGTKIFTFHVDVADEEQVKQAVCEAAGLFGRLDYVVHAAGISAFHQGGVAFAEAEAWNNVVNVNLSGTFFVLRAAAQIMLKQEPILSSIDKRPLQRGSIVAFASVLSVTAHKSVAAYVASKHGVLGLTRSASVDYAETALSEGQMRKEIFSLIFIFIRVALLSIQETNQARDLVLKLHPGAVIDFRTIYLLEPPKAEVLPFLALEHAGKVTRSTPRPARLAQAKYDVIGGSKAAEYHESVLDLTAAKVVSHEVIPTDFHAGLTVFEFKKLVECVKASPLFQEKLKTIKLPPGFELVVEPWPYGSPDLGDGQTRLFQCLCFGRNTASGSKDSNFYGYPIPFIPVMDFRKNEIIRVDEPATGGGSDPLTGRTHKPGIVDHCGPSEYVPELLPSGTRQDVKPLTLQQPQGPSFNMSDSSLIEWQKWRMRVTFNPREGVVIHDIRYDDRDVLYRLSISDMTVPYADPRTPYHRKQAFDFGDGGLGHAVNNLTLGCDCLGVIKYLDGVLTTDDGSAEVAKNIVCIHEQDNGINWKHTDWRTGRATVTRRRELVVQFIITLANYEYIFAFKFDQAAGIVVEARATGIVSVVNIDEGKTAPWGNVVSPGALAQNHQHIFCVRIDPAVDGHKNTLVQEDSLAVPMNERTNPHGNYYEVRQTPIATSGGIDLAPFSNRVFKVQNRAKKNPISGKPVGYKITTPPTQLLLADPNSIQAQRALFAKHHLWVTKFKDDELYAGGRHTLQSRREVGGVADAAARGDDVLDDDIVLWSVFGLTHNPRVEDWPVMPVEMLEVHITPVDFFTGNPAIDVPSNTDLGSKRVTDDCCENKTPEKPRL
ncbi:hypothetical protein L249_1115 [Ophiocordyceps polyrhachis-furcata BCC 54312]|uniref:Amine oxidase n=1 Tax=Ophiocordyceps polyrhachis-furcata BCC 54312 TaxID=1330021 RepID=A0A367LFA6_9HYPO|nr:hypothetical protein L249_1115 [Ophiocordyceps polyrhachis-furcata BCC 54312]